MTLLTIDKLKSCKECPNVIMYKDWLDFYKINIITYYCDKCDGRFISGQKLNPKVNIPKWCPLRKLDLTK